MEGHTTTLLNILYILIAVGSLEGIKISWKYFFNRKKNKVNDINDLYRKYNENTDRYIAQTEKMENTITELRNGSLAMEERIIEMSKKLDEKNQIIMSLQKETHALTEKTQQNTIVIKDLLKRAEVLENIKCEREGCENRIPPEKTILIKAK